MAEGNNNVSYQGKRWCFTLNRYTAEEEQLIMNSQVWSYLIYGKEIAASGTPHLQGYLELPQKMRFNTLKNSLGIPRIHLEAAQGSAEQNKEYCSKEGQVYESGEPAVTQPGKRNDLAEYKQALDAGLTDRELSEQHFGTWAKYPNVAAAYKRLRPPEKILEYQLDDFKWDADRILSTCDNRSIILWGDAGIGKTEFAKALIGPKYLFVSHIDKLLDFVDGYHEGIIFDDMKFEHVPREAQIHIVDRDNDREIHCRYRCAHIPKGIKKIFVCNIQNGRIFDLDDKAIRRRVVVHHLGGQWGEK